MTINRGIALLVLLTGFATTSAAQREYEVRFHTNAKQGDKYRFSASSASRSKLTFAGARNREFEQIVLYELESVMEALKVDAHGNIIQARFTIEKLAKTENDQEKEILSRGAKVIAEAGERDTTFKVEGGRLSEDQEAALGILIDLDPEDHLDDVIYGSKQKQQIGSGWEINAKAFAEKFRHRGYAVRDEDVSGKVKLEGTEQMDGLPCMKCAIQIKVANCLPPASDKLPDGLKRIDTSIEGTNTLLHPIDNSIHAFRLTFTSVINEKLESQNGRGPGGTGRFERAGEITILPMRD